jgi:hypothetical protein
MKEPMKPSDSAAHSRFRLDLGLDVLEAWAESAPRSEKNVVYKALFAMTDGSLFRNYRVIEDFQAPNEVFVIVRDNLMIKLRINHIDSFELLYVGPCGGAAGSPHRAA